jgi:hypothetical protein
MEPEMTAMCEGATAVLRERESVESFVLSIPAPVLLPWAVQSTQ